MKVAKRDLAPPAAAAAARRGVAPAVLGPGRKGAGGGGGNQARDEPPWQASYERSPGLLHRVGEEVRVHADAPEPIKAAEIVFRRRATSAPSP